MVIHGKQVGPLKDTEWEIRWKGPTDYIKSVGSDWMLSDEVALYKKG